MTNQNTARVLHVIHRMRPGGIQTAVMNLYRHVDRSQVQFDFAVRSQRPEYYDEEIQDLGGRLFHLPWSSKNPLSLYTYKNAFATILHQNSPFLAVHSHVGLFSGHILPAAKQANISLRFAHSHSAAPDSSLLRTIWGAFMRRSIKNSATHMLACSSQAADWLYGSQWEKDTRVTKFPNAIDIVAYAELDSDRLELRKAFGQSVKGPLIGHVGRFDSVKNHTFLLELFSTFHNKFPETRLILVGEGKLKQQIENQATAKGIREAVIFLGVRPDIPKILGSLDLFILPSLHEGFGIVLIEAQAAGVPCLASKGVSAEVDLGLGLIHFESLSSGIDSWAQQAIVLLNNQHVLWEKRKKALEVKGFDIRSSAKLLQDLYFNTAKKESGDG